MNKNSIMSHMRKKATIYAILLTLSLIISSYSFFVSYKNIYTSAIAEPEDGIYKITEMDPLSWGDRNLQLGDVVLSVNNGISPNDHPPLKHWQMLEQIDEITVEHPNGQIESIIVENKKDATVEFYRVVIPLITLILTIVCSVFIYRNDLLKNNSGKSGLYLIAFLLTLSTTYVNAAASSIGDLIARPLITMLMMLVPILYMHYIYHYFKEISAIWFNKSIIYFSYFLAILMLFITLSKYFLPISYLHIKYINLVGFFIVCVFNCYVIVKGNKKVPFKAQKYILKILTLTNVLAFAPFIVLYVIPYVIFRQIVFPPVFLVGFLLLIPFGLVYQFLATKLYDLEFFIGRIKYYSILSVIPAITGAIVVLSMKVDSSAVYSIRVFLMILIIFVAALYLKELIDEKFKLNKFSQKKCYQESLFEYTDVIRKAGSLTEVFSVLKGTIVETSLIETVFVYYVDRDNIVHASDSMDEGYKNEIFRKYENKIKLTLNDVGSIQEVNKGFIAYVGETEEKRYVIVGLSRLNTPKLTLDEKQWIRGLSYYTNVTLENFVKLDYLMKHIDEITSDEKSNPHWLNRILFSLEEKQRSALAKDLHDAVLQDLVSVKAQLEITKQKVKRKMEFDMIDELDYTINNMASAIDIARKTCNELRPQILYDLGLESALKKAVSQHIDEKYKISLNIRNLDTDIEKDVQLNIYRIIQELLNNAKKHAKPQNVNITAVKIKDKFILHYTDDGVGADQNVIFNKNNSLGLTGIRERVNMLKGQMEVITEQGKGFKATIEI